MASSSDIRPSDVEEFLKRRKISPEIRPPRHYFDIQYPFWVFQRMRVCPSVILATLRRNLGPTNGGGAAADQPPILPRVLQPVKKEELENLRTRLKVSTKEKDVDERPWKLRSNRSASEEKRSPVRKEKLKFNFALSRREIEEDFLKVLGRKPPSRPKKRPRKVQEEIDRLFPGTGINEITVDAYKVR